jgi:protein-disulfide isomerase
MDFPLDMHQNAKNASVAGLCAGDQGKFWEMSEKQFENASALDPENILKLAEGLGLNMAKFKECQAGGKHDAEIKAHIAEGQKTGISGTPSFLLGLIQPDGTVKATKKLVGAQPFASFKAAIDEMLPAGK